MFPRRKDSQGYKSGVAYYTSVTGNDNILRLDGNCRSDTDFAAPSLFISQDFRYLGKLQRALSINVLLEESRMYKNPNQNTFLQNRETIPTVQFSCINSNGSALLTISIDNTKIKNRLAFGLTPSTDDNISGTSIKIQL
jgi:hypothetical protein